MDNVEAIIKKHNSKIINQKLFVQEALCNCINKNNCPLKDECLRKDVIYKANVSYRKGIKHYFGLSEGEFKTRFNNHKMSFDLTKNMEKGRNWPNMFGN